MSLDGLRAWIGEVERKLGVRTRVFLVLTAIAIGGAGAGIYLSLDQQSDRVTESDLQAVQEDADARVAALEGEVNALEARLESLEQQGTPEPAEEGGPGGPSGDATTDEVEPNGAAEGKEK